ncbi:MAG: tRNA guanosine(34) transglycosylase Tgt [Patescibacteria group bacterium]|nr:tRNA guanosine(34) transglycosylase Tgt [Patescibacteria group bacterium]
MSFKILKRDKQSSARTGILKTIHGDIRTPVFMPVGTLGTVKTTTPNELKELGADIILGNTYHLYLRPGDKEIKKLGGLHNFINWDRPILTDSGGYQVFSLAKNIRPIICSTGHIRPKNLVKITPDGVHFQSHLDGSRHFFTPEKVVDIQRNLGSDIMMVLDECTSYPCSKKYAIEAMNRTHNWAEKAIEHFHKTVGARRAVPKKSLLFGIVQGSTFKDLRQKSAKFISSLPFDGIAIGGVSVGEGKKEMYKVLDWTIPHIRPTGPIRPIYLMGVGTPEDLLEAVERGVDMFDCVLPTRLARHGTVWYYEKTGGKLNLLNSSNKSYSGPIMKDCQCYACKNGFSRAYIHHLLKENEVLGIRLTTLHNLHFLLDLMRQIRDNIDKGTFLKFKKEFLKNWKI